MRHRGASTGSTTHWTGYNRTLQFMPEAQSQLDEVQERHQLIVRTRNEVEQIWQKALAKIAELSSEVSEQAYRQSYSSFGHSRWYMHGNVLDLDFDQLRSVFRRHCIYDSKHFASYLLKIIAAAIQMERESPSKYHSRYSLKDNIRLLSKALRNAHDPKAALHFFQFNASMIASVLPLNKVLSEDYELKHLNRRSRDHMRLAIMKAEPKDFLGAAAARREIWSRYQLKGCKEVVNTWSYSAKCFHGKHVTLLEDLTKRAHLEARSNVLLATGHKLPAELADLIFEQSLVAEDLPLETGFPMVKFPAILRGPYSCGQLEIRRYDECSAEDLYTALFRHKDDGDDNVDELSDDE